MTDLVDLKYLDPVIAYATEKHQGQKRKNSKADDYITHPIEVMRFLSNNGVTNKVTLMGAILHDTIEDTEATYEEIKEKFGKAVADVVLEVSDNKDLSKLVRKRLQLTEIAKKSRAARLIKLADKWSNTEDLKTDPPAHWELIDVNGYIIWSYEICRNIFSVGDVPDKLRDAIEKHFEKLGVHEIPFDFLDAYFDELKRRER